MRTAIDKLRGFVQALLYKYEIRADWGKDSFIVIKKINRWTGTFTTEERIIRTAY